MKASVVILGTVAEQEEAGDHTVVDPMAIDLTEWADARMSKAPVFRGGQYRVPDDVVGWWENPRVEEGRLVVDVEVDEMLFDHVSFSFAGIAGGGQARLIAVHATQKKENQ